MEIRFKKIHPNAEIPKRAYESDAGFDLVAVRKEYRVGNHWMYRTGLVVEIPEGYVGLIYPRSSIYRTDLLLVNSVGVIDSGYRGEVKVIFKQVNKLSGSPLSEYEIGDRIAQLVIVKLPEVKFVEALTLTESDRQRGGFGSTGK